MKVSTDSNVNGLQDPGVAIVCSFNYLSQKKSPRDALEFLVNVIENKTRTIFIIILILLIS